MKLKQILFFNLMLLLVMGCKNTSQTQSFEAFGVDPDTKENASLAAEKMVDFLKSREDTAHITVVFPKGRYDFYEEGSFEREYYISNHDQLNPKKVGFALEHLQNVTIDGQGSEFIFHGRMIPVSLLGSKNVTLKNISIDFEIPALRQLRILEVDKEKGEVTAELYPKGNYRVEENRLVIEGEGYELIPGYAMPFSPDKRLSYNRQDVGFRPASVMEKADDTLLISGWEQIAHTVPDERFVLRTGARPTPGIFISESADITLENVKVHYAEGMGLLAQMTENITLDGFSVCLRGDDDPRFFTTQADATHFSACKGVIISRNGLYEGMADDAINVHGTYLRITKRVDDHTLQGRYMHPQAWGFIWGESGDSVQFVESEKMELAGDHHINTIASIKSIDRPTHFGAKEFEISFTQKLPTEISEAGSFGVENLTWTPEVIFAGNTIRNNRARGSLFSTPRRVVCEDNLFDHTHGTAILLCGDCNGWYETGACTDVIIRNNRFVNALTANYQFTNAVISIYPVIPNLKEQEAYFHSGIIIENNTFEMFDKPILYAKSTDGLVFRNNIVKYNNEFEPFHWNEHLFFFERVNNVLIEHNQFGKEFDREEDIRIELSDINSVTINNE